MARFAPRVTRQNFRASLFRHQIFIWGEWSVTKRKPAMDAVPAEDEHEKEC